MELNFTCVGRIMYFACGSIYLSYCVPGSWGSIFRCSCREYLKKWCALWNGWMRSRYLLSISELYYLICQPHQCLAVVLKRSYRSIYYIVQFRYFTVIGSRNLPRQRVSEQSFSNTRSLQTNLMKFVINSNEWWAHEQKESWRKKIHLCLHLLV